MLEMIDAAILPTFVLIFVRMTAFLVSLPLFSYNTIPAVYKIGLAFFLSMVMLPVVDTIAFELDSMYVLLLLKEAAVGLLIGLVAYIVLSAVQIAGGFIDFQMGFAIANVIDPQTGAQGPLIGQYFYITALLFLLSVDGHHLLIDGMYYSYEFIPIDGFIHVGNSFAVFILETFNQMFMIAFQVSIPIVGCLFLVDIALGLIARTVPQLNVFVVGLPLKIAVSFLVLSFFIALYITLSKMLFSAMFDAMHQLMQIIGGVT